MKTFGRSLEFILIVIASFLALKLSMNFPFYYSWDMDLTVVQDLLLLQDDQMPTHFAHPGLGMNVVLLWSQELAQNFGLISKVSISNLGEALQPLLIIAEQTQFLRQINALFCILLGIALWMTLKSFLERSPILSVLALVVCLLLPSLWNYNIVLIRTETYSLLFWIISLGLTVKAVKEEDPPVIKRMIVLVGFFSALSFFTKIQVFFLLALNPLIYFYLKSDHLTEKSGDQPAVPVKKWFWIFFALCVAVIVIPFPFYVASFSSNWLPNKFFVIFCGLLFAIHSFQKDKNWTKRFQKTLSPLVTFLPDYFRGSFLVLVLPLFVPANIFTSFMSILMSFKVIFLRHSQFSEIGQFPLFENLWGNFVNNPGVILIAMGAVTLLFQKNQNHKKRFYLIGVFFLLVAHILLGVRDKTQDRIWLEIPVILMAGLSLGSLPFKQQLAGVVGLIFIFAATLFGTKGFTPSTSIAYFDQPMFAQEVYGFKQFKAIMVKAYTSEKKLSQGLRFSADIARWDSILTNSFPSEKRTLFHIRPFEDGFEIIFSNNDHFKSIANPDQMLSIMTPPEFKSQISVKGCLVFREETINHQEKNLIRITYMSERIDPWTQRRLPSECEFSGLTLDQQVVTLTPVY